MEECKCKPAKSYAERIIEYNEFVSLVKRMREAQEREAMLSGEEDDEFIAMVCVEARRAERKLDDFLEAIKDLEFKVEQ